MGTQATAGAPFFGRVEELDAVADLLGSCRVVTLTGAGGVGKTRIAEKVVERLDPSGESVCFVELADLSDPRLLGHVIAGEVGLQNVGDPTDADALIRFIGDRRALLVLDNCEHLVDAVAAQVAALVEGCAQLRVLLTSRVPLGIEEETVLPVDPLPVPDRAGIAVAELRETAAVALFVHRARAALPSFELTAENAAAVVGLIEVLEGLPLALELAAARVRALAPEVILERLLDRQSVLGSGFRDRPARHQSLEASVGWTYALCTPHEQVLWQRLSVFVGGFDLEAAAEASDDQISREDVADLLASLLDKSVVFSLSTSSARFRMLESIRHHGIEQLTEVDELDRWQRRHQEWGSRLVERFAASWVGPDQPAWLARLDAEHPNLRAALEFAALAGSTEAALRLCWQLHVYWVFTAQTGEARIWSERALAQVGGSAEARAHVLTMCALFGGFGSDRAYGADALERARPYVEASTDPAVRGSALLAEATLALFGSDLIGGSALLIEAVDAFRLAGDNDGLLRSLLYAGMNLGFIGDHERAGAMFLELFTICEESGETCIRSYALWSVSFASLLTGDLAGAESSGREALQLSWELRDLFGIGLRLETMSWLAACQGRPVEAATVLGAAASIWNRLDLRPEDSPYLGAREKSGPLAAHRSSLPSIYPDAYEAGRSMRVDAAVRYVLEGASTRETEPDVSEPPLTRRETQVAALVAQALSNRDIATRLFLSERTVGGHVQNILRKLGTSSRAGITAWFVRQSPPG